MDKTSKLKNTADNILGGFTGAMLTGAYAICFCTVTGLGLFNAFFCVVICALLSLSVKGKIFSPDAFLLIPFIYASSPDLFPFIIIISAVVFFVLKKAVKPDALPHSVFAGVGLGLALAVTVLVTNVYFGIGADGTTPLEMLSSYRSHGFHPHFHGLLYGTVTLFAMITYPFKFKKLNKYLPAEFVTLLIPLILNLFLNPDKSSTVINEADFLSRAPFVHSFIGGFSDISASDITNLLQCGFALGVILFLFSEKDKRESNMLAVSNLASGSLCTVPVKAFDIRAFSVISAIVMIAVSTLVVYFFPDYIDRIPAHSIGALLIVSAWQHTPFSAIAKTFKRKSISEIIATVIITASFIICDIFSAVIITLAFAVILRKVKKNER